jgi:hypothetical protein
MGGVHTIYRKPKAYYGKKDEMVETAQNSPGCGLLSEKDAKYSDYVVKRRGNFGVRQIIILAALKIKKCTERIHVAN